MPALVSASVPTMVASASIFAVWSKKDLSWRDHTSSRARLTAACNAITEVSSKRRQKSPAVVGSGNAAAPKASRNTRSPRRSSMSSRVFPPHTML